MTRRARGRKCGPAAAAAVGRRPSARPTPPLLDPPPQQVDLRGGQGLAEPARAHAPALPRGGDSAVELAGGRAAGHRGAAARVQFGQGAVLAVEAETGLAPRLVRPVAGVAVVREDGPDVPVEIDLSGGSGG